MPLSPADRERLRHERKKREISNTFAEDAQTKAMDENADEWVVGIIVAMLEALAALLLIPDPTWTKVLAVILAVGVGILGAYVIIRIVRASKNEFIESIRKRNNDENEEDDRHREALAGM